MFRFRFIFLWSPSFCCCNHQHCPLLISHSFLVFSFHVTWIRTNHICTSGICEVDEMWPRLRQREALVYKFFQHWGIHERLMEHSESHQISFHFNTPFNSLQHSSNSCRPSRSSSRELRFSILVLKNQEVVLGGVKMLECSPGPSWPIRMIQLHTWEVGIPSMLHETQMMTDSFMYISDTVTHITQLSSYWWY